MLYYKTWKLGICQTCFKKQTFIFKQTCILKCHGDSMVWIQTVTKFYSSQQLHFPKSTECFSPINRSRKGGRVERNSLILDVLVLLLCVTSTYVSHSCTVNYGAEVRRQSFPSTVGSVDQNSGPQDCTSPSTHWAVTLARQTSLCCISRRGKMYPKDLEKSQVKQNLKTWLQKNQATETLTCPTQLL